MSFWFGNLPSGWKVIKLKYITTLKKTKTAKNVNYVGLENIESRSSCFIPNESSCESEGQNQLFSTGDILFCKLRPYLAKVWEATFSGSCSSEFLVLKPNNQIVDSVYLKFVLLSPKFIDLVNGSTFGAKMPRANWEFIGNQLIPLPSIEVQHQISAKIKAAIEKIQNVLQDYEIYLEELNGLRQSLIANAVTKGLDPTVPMRDSGIPWIGKIPAHWKTGKLANVGKFQAGSAFPESFQGERNNQIPFYKVADLSQSFDDWHMNDTANTITPQQADQLKASIIPSDCIVYAKIGAAMLLNKRRVTVKNCCIDNNMTAYQPTGIHIDWAYFWLEFVDFGIFSFPATVPSLSEGRQGRIPVLIPPQNEQEVITNFIKKKMRSIHAISKQVCQTIDSLKEFRDSLVSNVFVAGAESNRGLKLMNTEVVHD